MSADNGVYVLKSNKIDGGYEYRIAHGFESTIMDIGTEEITPQEELEILTRFGNSQIFEDQDDAWDAAIDMEVDIQTEYGVDQIVIDYIYGTLRSNIATKRIETYESDF